MSYAEKLARLQEMRQELRALERDAEREAQRMQPITEADERAMLGMQARADASYTAAGRRADAPRPMEKPADYRRRLVAGLQKLSPRWRAGGDIQRMPDDVLEIVESHVYADALKFGPTADLRPGQIKEVKDKSGGGHTVIEFRGNDAHFTQQFSREPRVGIFKSQAEYLAMSQAAQLSRVGEIVRTMRPPLSAPRAAF